MFYSDGREDVALFVCGGTVPVRAPERDNFPAEAIEHFEAQIMAVLDGIAQEIVSGIGFDADEEMSRVVGVVDGELDGGPVVIPILFQLDFARVDFGKDFLFRCLPR